MTKNRESKMFEYTRPTEQMGIAIVYGGISEICNSMDNNDLKEALEEVETNYADDEWDLIHYPNSNGMGGKFKLIWWKN